MANKKKFDKVKDFPLRLEESDYEKVDIIAQIEDMSINDVFNEAIRDYIQKKIKKYNNS